jgi:Family of unknown function (DUF6328)
MLHTGQNPRPTGPAGRADDAPPAGDLPRIASVQAEAGPPGHRHECRGCSAVDDHDEWNAAERGETPLQRADRAYGEILQEVRVAQTGVQILFAFLLALAFQARFASVTHFQRDAYAVTLMLCAAATALLIAPAAFHRLVYRRKLKQHLVRAASRLALSGLVLLMLSLVSAVLLILDVVFGTGPAVVMASGTLGWFFAWWFVLPAYSRIRHAAADHSSRPEDGQEPATSMSSPHRIPP